MRLTQKQKLSKTIRWLRQSFPAFVPVYTQQVNLRTLCGDCSYVSHKSRAVLLIRMNQAAKYQVKIDTLLHEWAHALTWFDCAREDHPNVWGEAYARIYRAWLKWNFGKGEK